VSGGFIVSNRTTRQWRRRNHFGHKALDRMRRLTPPAKLDEEWNDLLTATEQVYRAEFGLYATSPIPTRDSKRWRRLKRQERTGASRALRAAALLPLGVSCRTGSSN
jgi:hypothetical protein